MSTPKSQQRQGAPEPSELIQLLVDKDKEIKDCLKTGIKLVTFSNCYVWKF